MSVYVLIDVQIKPEALEQVKTSLKAALPETRAFDGCQGSECYANKDDPNNLIVVDAWETKQHHEKYSAWRDETGFNRELLPAFAAPLNVRYLERLDM